jgi:hypothetical protein
MYISLHAVLPAFCAVLRRADEHLHEIVVQCVIELALKAPFELRIVQVTRMKIEVVGMHGERWVSELDNHFYTVAFGARGKIQQRVLVEAELGEDAVEAGIRGFRHQIIVR